jgi:CHASE2 domain-containing sensor protein
MLNGLKKDAFFCTLMTFVIGAFLYTIFINLSVLNPFEKAFKDFEFTDVFFAERFNEKDVNQKIILVNIKHASRIELAQAINNIALQKPKVIGLDIIFKDRKLEFEDSILKSVLSKTKTIVTSYFKSQDSIVTNHTYFNSKDHAKGFINLNLPNQSSVIREFVGVKRKEHDALAFATQMALVSGYIDDKFITNELQHAIPINYIGNKEAFLNFDIDEVLDMDVNTAFKDALVIMGYLGDGNPNFDIEDKHFTPLNASWVGKSAPDTFGVTIHANILNMLTKNTIIYSVPRWIIYSIAFFVTYFLIYISLSIYKKNSFIFDITEKIIQLVLSVLLLYLGLLLLQINIHVSIMPIILFSILGIEMIDYYEHLVVYLNKKFGWKSQLL